MKEVIPDFFFLINDLLHGACRQAVVDTLYLLRYADNEMYIWQGRRKRKKKRKGTKKRSDQMHIGDEYVSLWILKPAFSHSQNKMMLDCQW